MACRVCSAPDAPFADCACRVRACVACAARDVSAEKNCAYVLVPVCALCGEPFSALFIRLTYAFLPP